MCFPGEAMFAFKINWVNVQVFQQSLGFSFGN